MMEGPQGQQSSGFVERIRRANSFPNYNSPNVSAKAMGFAFRTPSPRREPYFATDGEITPKRKSYLCPPLKVTTPPGSPRGSPDMPTTPTQEQVSKNTYGLLTPCTPHFDQFLLSSSAKVEDKEAGSTAEQKHDLQITYNSSTHHINVGTDGVGNTGGSGPSKTQVDNPQEQIADAVIAACLAEETDISGKRRSTRIAKKAPAKVSPIETVTTTVVTRPAKRTKHILPDKDVSPPISSFTADAVVHLLPDVNPAILTLDWQLQYPPGGSTHPSYAYPQLDPRLFFDPAQIPVVDGLPTVFNLAPIVLPMGWRHVSWSGFLPIVFDQYHQAFKLTPIGPLPLTCEEVQQGGLAKYVPGGSEHPEAGMLPDCSLFSDGSDEIYNFDGLDWVLPWPENENFDGSESAGILQHGNGPSSSSTNGKSTSAVIMKPYSHYFEAQDCPNDIVDIEDAWRWLAEKELDPAKPFVPTPTKSWKGTGIRTTSRKYKEPIASLMGLVIGDVTASPNNGLASFLIKQNGRVFCPFQSMATSVHVNITLLKDVEITLAELLSYFPNHYMWRKGSDRLVGAGLTAADITNFINWTRGLEGDATMSQTTINNQIMWEYDASDSRKKVKIVRQPYTATYTTEGWVYTAWQLTDYPLLGLAHGLKHYPEGTDAGPLTAIMNWARKNGRYKTLLSEVPDLLEEAEIQPLIEPGEFGDPDREVMPRYAQTLKKDRIRMLKDAGMRKRAAEKAEGGKRKRAKGE